MTGLPRSLQAITSKALGICFVRGKHTFETPVRSYKPLFRLGLCHSTGVLSEGVIGGGEVLLFIEFALN